MIRNGNSLSRKLTQLLRDSKSTLDTLTPDKHISTESASTLDGRILRELLQELITGLEGMLSLGSILETEEGKSISCETFMKNISQEREFAQLFISLESPLPHLFINEERFLSALRWLFRGALRNGHTHARISSKEPELIISFSATGSTPTEAELSHKKSILEYLIADEILSFYGHSLSWNETDGLSTCLIPIFEMNNE